MSLPIVYHGSPNRFERFDYKKIRENGTSEGVGFYFTDARHIAENYANNGFLYTARFTGTNPLSNDELIIDKNEFKHFLNVLDSQTDYLSNWGEVAYEGRDTVLERAVDGEYDTSDDDVELIAGVVNSSGNPEAVLTLCHDILGRDCIITGAEWGGGQKLYIALTHDAYEILDIEPFKQS